MTCVDQTSAILIQLQPTQFIVRVIYTRPWPLNVVNKVKRWIRCVVRHFRDKYATLPIAGKVQVHAPENNLDQVGFFQPGSVLAAFSVTAIHRNATNTYIRVTFTRRMIPERRVV